MVRRCRSSSTGTAPCGRQRLLACRPERILAESPVFRGHCRRRVPLLAAKGDPVRAPTSRSLRWAAEGLTSRSPDANGYWRMPEVVEHHRPAPPSLVETSTTTHDSSTLDIHIRLVRGKGAGTSAVCV